jgi:hypothetical protein
MTTVRLTFGWDVLDTIEDGFAYTAFDVIDVLDDRHHDIPTRCPQCNAAWLMSPQALAAGKCWRCRTNGGPS